MVMQGNLSSADIKANMESILAPLDIEYVAIVNRSFQSLDEVAIGDTIVLVAARVGTTRLIDNVWM
jgi:pantoate--beta-alanine ligase